MSKRGNKKLKPDIIKPQAPGLIGIMAQGYQAEPGDPTKKSTPKLASPMGLGIVGQYKRKARH